MKHSTLNMCHVAGIHPLQVMRVSLPAEGDHDYHDKEVWPVKLLDLCHFGHLAGRLDSSMKYTGGDLFLLVLLPPHSRKIHYFT